MFSVSCNQNTEMPGFESSLFKNSKLSKLVSAMKLNDSNEVKRILQHNTLDLNYHEPKYGNTVLMLAVAHNQTNIAKILLSKGAKTNEVDFYDKATALIYACDNYSQDCSTAMVQLLIDYKADVNYVQKIDRVEDNGAITKVINTPLTLAAKNGCIPVAKCLLNAGADINAYTYYDGFGVITESLLQENLEMAKFFIIDEKAKIPDYCFIRNKGDAQEQRLTIKDLINEIEIPKSSSKYNLKEALLNYIDSLK